MSFRTLFDAKTVLDEAWIPKADTDQFFPVGSGVPDKHQQEMWDLLTDQSCEAALNPNPTGSGKTISWAGPVIRSSESGDPWMALATYPTRALVEDQYETITELFERYYTHDDYNPANGFELTYNVDGTAVLTDGSTQYPVKDRVVVLTSESTRGENTGDRLVEEYEGAVDAYADGVPTIFLTTPDTLTLLAANRFRNNDAGGIPGLVDVIVVDEFHLSNPRGKRLLPFHLDVYLRLADNQYLSKTVFLSATPVPSYVSRLERTFDVETVSREVYMNEPETGGRKILPETELFLTSRPMFTNGGWLKDSIDEVLDMYDPAGQMVVILDSVQEVETVASALESHTDLDIGRIYGWKRVGRDRAVSESDILVGNTAVEVGVDFEDVNRMVFTAYDPNSAIQRLGRMRNSESLQDFKVGMITTPYTHNRVVSDSFKGRLRRQDFETALYDTLDSSSDRPYYGVLCAIYARFLWSEGDSEWGSALSESYLPERETDYKELVHRHFSSAVTDLTGETPGVDEFWAYLWQLRQQYRDPDGSYPVFEEMHTYRPSSLSCVIIDTTDDEEPLKSYNLHYVLRYCRGRVLNGRQEAEQVFRSEIGRSLTDSETEFLDDVSAYGCGFFVSYGTIDTARNYWIADYSMLPRERRQWNENPSGCTPTEMFTPSLTTNPPVEGVENFNLEEESILTQYVGSDVQTTRERFGLGPYANAVPVDDSDTLLLWQDGILAHSQLMTEELQARHGTGDSEPDTSQTGQTTLTEHGGESDLHRIKEKAHDFSRGMNPATHDTNHER